jgi:hypothetical protein
MNNPLLNYVLVTGDVVIDCHLYGGLETGTASSGGSGTVYAEHLGGAALTCKLLQASSDEKGLVWDAKKSAWDKENMGRAEGGKKPLPWPEDLAESRPVHNFEIRLDLDDSKLEQTLPKHLRSYGVWNEKPQQKGSKERVWRVDRDFGYGSRQSGEEGVVFSRTAGHPSDPPTLTLIDEGGILFRHCRSKDAWPPFESGTGAYYLLKMSWPLCRGDLWTALEPVMDRLIVVVAADHLRREDIQINSRLSWEQCAEHTVSALLNHPIAKELLRAAQVVISFSSAGALWVRREIGAKSPSNQFQLIFDSVTLEGDFERDYSGTAYGFQTCIAVGIAQHLMQRAAKAGEVKGRGSFEDPAEMDKGMLEGIAAGLRARRRLLELGHGPIGGPKEPGFPMQELGQIIARNSGGFVSVAVPPGAAQSAGHQWTILSQSEAASEATGQEPLIGLAQLTARYGVEALSHVPALQIGQLFTVDRKEIESLRTLDSLMRAYEETKVQKKPLSIGVFGPPGAGKSFGVKALAKAVLGDKVPFLEFNLSQFMGAEELVGALHRVRDAVLGGTTPVAFWDEFDSQQYKWLQYLLAPMQDGSFQEGQIIHPIGKCIFIFAGGTSDTIEEFGVAEPKRPTDPVDASEEAGKEQETTDQAERYRQFKLLKGPDFISRLDGFLNVLGPNERTGAASRDVTWPIRRALILRGILGLKANDKLDIDPGLLYALLRVPRYYHGARSFEKILAALFVDRKHGRLQRSSLLPQPLLNREADAEAFHALLTQSDAFKNHPDLETLAAAIHHNFLDGAKKSQLQAEMEAEPQRAWTIHPAIQKQYDLLDADVKAANRAAARRIPDHLALIGYALAPQRPGDDGSWKKPLSDDIQKHLDRLAIAEHLGWCEERGANGWSYGEVRDNNRKLHPALVPWAQLAPSDQDKDRSNVLSIVEFLGVAGYKAVRAYC